MGNNKFAMFHLWFRVFCNIFLLFKLLHFLLAHGISVGNDIIPRTVVRTQPRQKA